MIFINNYILKMGCLAISLFFLYSDRNKGNGSYAIDSDRFTDVYKVDLFNLSLKDAILKAVLGKVKTEDNPILILYDTD